MPVNVKNGGALVSVGNYLYAFQGDDPHSRDNVALRESFEDQSPLIYFYALVPGVYDILFPCNLTGWDARALRCTVAVGSAHELARHAEIRIIQPPLDRRYTTVEAKVRLHQGEFRALVLLAGDLVLAAQQVDVERDGAGRVGGFAHDGISVRAFTRTASAR